MLVPPPQDELAARIGHELRNPLNALCAALEVLETRPPADAVAAEALAIAARQARRMVKIVDEMVPRAGSTSPS